ncbi:unnamed protein product [Prorocentrum cordatum]|uniref:Calmodulin n=1 Tax=Prorocentrum cordatum TaxID=2364126 RepID=A0ABN9WTF3_9DINO|nr:unnamed protein product [Polarella glacialis]
MRFAMAILPETAAEDCSVHFYWGSAGSLRPLPVRDAFVAAILSHGDVQKMPAHPEAGEASEASEGGAKELQEIRAQVETVHLQICAEVVYHELRHGRWPKDEEIQYAFGACNQACVAVSLRELATVSRSAGVGDVAAVWDHLGVSAITSLERQGFQCFPRTSCLAGLSWVCFFRAEGTGEGTGVGSVGPPDGPLDQNVCFLKVEVPRTGRADPKDPAVEPEICSSIFRAAYEKECADEVRIVVHFLAPESHGWGKSAQAARPGPHQGALGNSLLDFDAEWERLRPDVADRLRPAVRFVEELAVAVSVAHANLTRCAWPTSPASLQTLRRVVGSPEAALGGLVHSCEVELPVARPRAKARARELLARELEALEPEEAEPAQGLARGARLGAEAAAQGLGARRRLGPPRRVQDGAFVWVAPDAQAAGSGGRGGSGPPGQRAEACRRPGEEASPFWALMLLPEDIDPERFAFLAQLSLLFTPQGELDPEPYFAMCRASVARAAARANQKLLLEQMATEQRLSELLHPDLRADGVCDDDLTPQKFLDREEKVTKAVSSEGPGEADRERGGEHAARAEPGSLAGGAERAEKEREKQDKEKSEKEKLGEGEKGKSQPPRKAQPARMKQLAELMPDLAKDFDNSVEAVPAVPEEDPRFVRLLRSPEDLHCRQQSQVSVPLVKCLHHFRIINWLAGGTAEGSERNTSAKVSFQRQRNAQHNEAVSAMFERNRLQTRRRDTVWIRYHATDGGTDLFIRPRYVRAQGDGAVDPVELQLDFYGLQKLSEEQEGLIRRTLVAQLEKLAIAKLSMHTLDRQQASLSASVMDFLCPPQAGPGRSLLVSIPPLERGRLPTYTQFVRRALLGLLEPLSEEVQQKRDRPPPLSAPEAAASGGAQVSPSRGDARQRQDRLPPRSGSDAAPAQPVRAEPEEVDDARAVADAQMSPQRRAAVGDAAPQPQPTLSSRSFSMNSSLSAAGVGSAVPQARASFLYKRRAMRQMIHDAKGSEKVRHFEGRVGDGVALLQLFFVDPGSGLAMEEAGDSQAGPGVDEQAGGRHRPKHTPIEDDCVVRQDGRFHRVDFKRMTQEDRSSTGYILLDVWPRAMSEEQASELIKEIQVALDQAMAELYLQLTLRQATEVLDSVGQAEPEQYLQEFCKRCDELLYDMPHQHPSSVFTHSPEDIAASLADPDRLQSLPLWAFVKIVEGLQELLLLAGQCRGSRPVVVFQAASEAAQGQQEASKDGRQGSSESPATSDAEDEAHEEFRHWFDVEDKMWTIRLQKFVHSSRGERSASPSSLLRWLERSRAPGPRFTVMWGPTMGRLQSRLQCRRQEQANRGLGEPMEELGFVEQVARGCLRLPRRLDQHRVEQGGSARLRNQTLEQWREADECIRAEQLSEPFLAITLDSTGARIRGVSVEDPSLVLKVQYFLESQFRWVWVRTRLLELMCGCETGGSAAASNLRGALQGEFQWLFDRPGSLAHLARASDAFDDRHSKDEGSVHSTVAAVERVASSSPYTVFGLPKAVAERLMLSEMVPAPYLLSLDAHLMRCQSVNDTDSVLARNFKETSYVAAVAQIGGAAAGGVSQPQAVVTGRDRTTATWTSNCAASMVSGQSESGDQPPRKPLHRVGTVTSESMSELSQPYGPGRPGHAPPQPHIARQPQLAAARCREIPGVRTADCVLKELCEPEEATAVEPDVVDLLGGQALVTALFETKRRGARRPRGIRTLRWVRARWLAAPRLAAPRRETRETLVAKLRWVRARWLTAPRRAAPQRELRETPLLDPLSVHGASWFANINERMRLHRWKLVGRRVLQEWEEQRVPLAAWARAAVAAHARSPDADEQLRELAEAAARRQSRVTVQDTEAIEGEVLLLSLLHRHATLLGSDWHSLFVRPYCEAPDAEGQRARDPSERGSVAAPAPPEPGAEAPKWGLKVKSRSLSEKLSQDTPLLTIRQRFLSSVLAAFQRPSALTAEASDADIASATSVASWALVLCLENPLPWHDWDVLGEVKAGLWPQTLLLHRTLPGAASSLLAEVSCRSNDSVCIEIFAQDAGAPGEAAEEILSAIHDFCFDFQMRCLTDSCRPVSHAYQCSGARALLDEGWLARGDRRHPRRARNLYVQGEVPPTRLVEWLGLPGGGELGAALAGLQAKDLVSFMHETAAQYGFKCSGEEHEPLLSMHAEDHRFLRALRLHAARHGAHPEAGPEAAREPAQLAQGIRCVLFACPVCEKPSRARTGRSGTLGFRFAALLVDLAWCTPPCEAAAEHTAEWESLEVALADAAQDALKEFARLAAVRLVLMRRFKQLSKQPSLFERRDMSEVLANCGTSLDLCEDPFVGRTFQALRRAGPAFDPAASWQRLGVYLRSSAFKGRCIEFTGPVGERRDCASSTGSLEGSWEQRHLLIVARGAFGVADDRRAMSEDKRYVLLHLMWGRWSSEAAWPLEGAWLHCSHRLRQARHAAGGPPRPEEPRGLCAYADEWPDAEPGQGDLRRPAAALQPTPGRPEAPPASTAARLGTGGGRTKTSRPRKPLWIC